MSDTLLSDLEAEDITNHFDSLPPDQQPVARNRLRAYFDEKDRRRAEAFRSVESLMLDAPEDFAKSNPAAVKPLMQPDDWDETRELAGLSTLTGADPRRISKAPGAFRAAVADSWGQPDIATDVPKFRARLKAHFQKSRDARLLGDDLASNARKAEVLNGALLDPAIIPTWDKWSQESGSKPGFSPWQTGAYFQKWSDERKATREKLAAVKDDVEAVWSILGGGGERGYEPSTPDLTGLAQRLSKLPSNKRKMALWAVQTRADALPEDQKTGFWERWKTALDRSFLQMGEASFQGVNRMARGTVSEQVSAEQDALEDLRRLRDTKLDPFERSDDGLLANVGLSVAGSIPALGAAFAGPVGWYAIGAQMAEEGRAASRPALQQAFRSQGLTEDQADQAAGKWSNGLGIAAGAINTAFEKLTFGMATGVPGIRGLQAKLITTASESLAKRIALRGGAFALEAGEQQIQEAVQDAMPFALADAAQAVGLPLPEVDGGAKEFLSTLTDPTTLGVSLLFAAGGFGKVDGVTLAEGLRREGVEAPAIEQVLTAPKEKRAEAAIAAIQAVPPEARASAQASAARQDAAAKAAGAIGALPTFRVNPDGIGVFLNGQHIGNAPTTQAAMELGAAASEHFADMDADQTALLASMLETADVFATQQDGGVVSYTEVSPNRRTVAQQLAESAAQGDTQTEARLREEIRLMAEAEGVDPATLSLIAGDNVTTFQNGVAYSVSRVFEGASPLTVVHENAHGSFKAGLRNGVFTRAGTIKVVRGVEQATGQKFFQSTDDTAIGEAELEETVMQLAEAEVLGRRKRGDALAPGAITKGIAAYIRQEARSGAAALKEALSFKHFMSAVRRTMKAVFSRALALRKAQAEGKLGDDYHSFLNKLLGVDSQLSHEDAVSEAALDYVPPTAEQEAAGMAFSLANSRAVPADTSRQFVMPDGARLIGPTVFSIKAYHGTPHKVDRFSTERIGTGEGAQAYGWGLYFAEDRAVGESYKTDLSLTIKVDGNTVLDKNGRTRKWTEFGTAEAQAETLLISNRGDIEKAINKAQSSGAFARAVPILEAMRGKVQAETSGNLYTVELLPDEEDFLDWDKPLSGQSEKVKAALGKVQFLPYDKSVHKDPRAVDLYAWADPNPYGGSTDSKASAEALRSAGIPGIKYLDGNSRDGGSGTRNFVIFDDKLVKILEENGKPVEQASPSFALAPQRDAEYLKAVEAGDMDTAQRMVDEAAKRAGYDVGPVWHGTRGGDFTVFKKELTGTANLLGDNVAIFHSDRKGTAADFAQRGMLNGHRLNASEINANVKPSGYRVMKSFLRISNPMAFEDYAQFKNWLRENADTEELSKTGNNGQVLSSLGFDGFVIKKPGYARGREKWYGVFDSNQIKSADPVTRDEAGNVIPLSKRFNSESPDIRFSLAPAGRLSVVEDRVQKALDKDPEMKRRVFTDIRSKLARLANDWSNLRWTPKGDRIEPIAEKRSAKSLAKEQAFREATRRDELTSLYAGPIEHQFAGIIHQPELAKLGEHPLFQMLRSNLGGGLFKSRIMSPTQSAIRDLNAGRMDQHGDYDGADGIPRMMFGGTEAPDTLAQEAFEAGLIKDATPDALWDGIRAGLRDVAQARDDLKYALDALKDAQRRARDEAKAEASQWRREADAAQKRDHSPKAAMLRDLVTLDAMLTTLPPEVRAKVGGYVSIARLGTDASRLAELQKRADMIGREMEAFLRKFYADEIQALFDRAKPTKGGPGEKPIGKTGADVYKLVQAAAGAMSLTPDETDARLAEIDTLLAADDLSPEAEAMLQRERGLVELFGAWHPKSVASQRLDKNGNPIYVRSYDGADAARRAAAFDSLKTLIDEGMADWKQELTRRKERRDAMRAALKASTGKSGSRSERVSKDKEAKTLFGKGLNFLLSISSFEEVALYAFGDGSSEARAMVDQERAASNAYEDEMQDVTDSVQALFEDMAGSPLKAEKLRFQLSQRTKDGGVAGEMSEMEIIQAVLMWRQEDGRRHMTGPLDEDGKPAGPWHFDQTWVDSVTAQLSPEGRRVLDHIAQEYAAEYETLNPLYEQRHGISLPANANYAPITVAPQQASAGQMVDPVSGAAVTGSILTPGSLRTRSRSAVAEPDFKDGLQVFLAHKRLMAHWKAYYDFAVEAQQVLGDREVGNAVSAAAGEQAKVVLRKFVDAFAQGGSRDAAAGLAATDTLQRMTGRAAAAALIGRVAVLMIQGTQLAAAAVEMPVGAYLKRLGKLLSGNLGWGDAIRSDYIQRRLRQMRPIIRQAMEALAYQTEPNRLKHEVARLGRLINGADGLFTGGTYAILLDYHRENAAKLGLTGAEAEKFAHENAARSTDRVAQPTRMGARSIWEVTSTNPLARLSWAFASDPRQKIALTAWALKNWKTDPGRASKAAFLAWGVGGLMAQILRNAYRDLKDDGDDEVFDERNWSPTRLVISTLAGPLQGLPGVSAIIETGGNLFSGGSRGLKAAGELVTGKTLDDDEPVEATMEGIDAILTAAALFSDNAAALASLAHAGLDGAKLIDSLSDDDVEAGLKQLRKEAAERKNAKGEPSDDQAAAAKERKRARIKAAADRAKKD